MKVVDAFWEKRNISCDVKEISLSFDDDPQEVSRVLLDVKTPYSTVKIPCGNVSLLFAAQEAGYSVIETQVELFGDLSAIVFPDYLNRFRPHISVKQADEQLKQRALEEIASGESFGTDRIALDPAFSPQIAGIRYRNWVCDELERGANMVIAMYKDAPATFGIYRKLDDQTYNAFLGGVFLSMKNRGLGFMAVHAINEGVRAVGGSKVITHVSSNNLPILRLHMSFGYEIKSMSYVLIKHQRDAE